MIHSFTPVSPIRFGSIRLIERGFDPLPHRTQEEEEPRDAKMAGDKTASPRSGGSSGSLVSKAAAAAAREEEEEEEEETRPLLLPSGSTNGTTPAPAAAAASVAEGEEEPGKPATEGSSSSKKKTKQPRLSASDKHALKRLWRETVPPEKGYMTAGVVAMLVSSATNMAFPRLVGQVLDRTTKAAAEKEDGRESSSDSASSGASLSLQAFVARALLIFLAGAVGSCVRTHCLRMAKEGTSRRLRKKLLRSLLAQVRTEACMHMHCTRRRSARRLSGRIQTQLIT